MTDDPPSVEELADRVAELPPEDRRALLVALESDRGGEIDTPIDRWESYCEEHPYDPLCAGFASTTAEPQSASSHRDVPQSASSHLDAFGGGGCAELWEYLSAYRDATGRR